MSIRHWPTAEQPAHKLIDKGPAYLSDSELLSLLIRTGLPGVNAVDIARDALTTFGSLRAFLTSDIKEFCAVRGLGQSKYVQFQAALEIARRYLFEEIKGRPALSSPKATRDYLALKIAHLPYEVFIVIYIDSQNQILACEEAAKGTIDGASVYPREIIKRVLYHNAAAIVCSHQHPSNICEPSQADHRITERLKQALGMIDCRVLDHILYHLCFSQCCKVSSL